jgi:hypothetical protein
LNYQEASLLQSTVRVTWQAPIGVAGLGPKVLERGAYYGSGRRKREAATRMSYISKMQGNWHLRYATLF